MSPLIKFTTQALPREIEVEVVGTIYCNSSFSIWRVGNHALDEREL